MYSNRSDEMDYDPDKVLIVVEEVLAGLPLSAVEEDKLVVMRDNLRAGIVITRADLTFLTMLRRKMSRR